MKLDELEKLYSLKEKGIITEEQFNEKKQQILYVKPNIFYKSITLFYIWIAISTIIASISLVQNIDCFISGIYTISENFGIISVAHANPPCPLCSVAVGGYDSEYDTSLNTSCTIMFILLGICIISWIFYIRFLIKRRIKQ